MTTPVLGLFLLTAGLLQAENMPVPMDVQGKTFKTIFSYDKALGNVPQIKVLIVGADEDDENVQELMEAFRGAGAFPALVDEVELGVWITTESVVYVMPDADFAQVRRSCDEARVLSISGVPSLAEQGNVSVGLDKKGKGIEIIVNLQRLSAEEHELSADLLRLARVIR